nr:hypothetical protein [Tanacetum cinerariifolium]
MMLKFADTHNMVAYLSKSNASEGFNQIVDFLNESYIAYALTINPTIYVSCIKQFWNTVAVKQSNDVIRLQVLVDKKKVVVTKSAIRDTLHLDDTEGVDCFPNEEIFTALARMGYEKPSTKLTFYKAFFSRVDTPLFKGMLVAREPEEHGDAEEQSNDDNATEEPVTAVDDVEDQSIPSPTPPTPPSHKPQDIPSISQAQSPPPQPQSSIPAQPQGVDFLMSLLQEALDTCAALTRRVEHLEHDKVAQNLVITKLKTRVKKLERANKVKTLKLKRLRKVGTSQRIESSDDTIIEDVSNQGRMIDELDKDEGVELMNEKEETKEVKDITGDAQVKGRHAEIYQINMDHAVKVLKVVAAISEIVNAAPVVPTVTTTVVPTITTSPVKVVVPSTSRRRGVVIKDLEEESSAKTLTKTKSMTREK